jgi:hypothetical protein
VNEPGTPDGLQPARVAQFRRGGCIKLKSVLSPPTLSEYGRKITRLTVR